MSITKRKYPVIKGKNAQRFLDREKAIEEKLKARVTKKLGKSK